LAILIRLGPDPVTIDVMFGNIGPLEIIIVLVIALVVFGPKRLPELGNSLGRSLREFKDTVSGDKDDDDDDKDEDVKALTASQATTVPVEKPATPVEAPVDSEPVNDKSV
jgi:sec-independent protein translocase protein TatA